MLCTKWAQKKPDSVHSLSGFDLHMEKTAVNISDTHRIHISYRNRPQDADQLRRIIAFAGDILTALNSSTLSDYYATHPHPNPPLEGEGIFSRLHPAAGGVGRGMG